MANKGENPTRVQYHCFSCGKNQDQVKRLIAGPGAVNICDECVELYREIIGGLGEPLPTDRHELNDVREAYRVEPQDEEEELRGTTRLSGKNQLTLPVAMVRALGWRAGDEVDLMIDGEEIWLRRRLRGRQLLDRLEGALSHVPEWQTDEGIRAWVRGERDSWDREWDSEEKHSRSGSAG